VDLRFVGHAVGGQAECADCPIEVALPFRSAQRQTLAQCGLVDLNDADTGLL
jgi:hypothetical protein